MKFDVFKTVLAVFYLLATGAFVVFGTMTVSAMLAEELFGKAMPGGLFLWILLLLNFGSAAAVMVDLMRSDKAKTDGAKE